jgi:hypothetical protein
VALADRSSRDAATRHGAIGGTTEHQPHQTPYGGVEHFAEIVDGVTARFRLRGPRPPPLPSWTRSGFRKHRPTTNGGTSQHAKGPLST